jgi:hypothetical protein
MLSPKWVSAVPYDRSMVAKRPQTRIGLAALPSLAPFWFSQAPRACSTAPRPVSVADRGRPRENHQISGAAMFRGYPYAARRRASSRTALAFAAMSALWSAPARAQMFAHRVVLPVPLDDTTRAVGLLPGFSYFADIQRGWQSTNAERAWDARLGGTIELWRLSPATSILIGTADEMVANSLKDDGFNPRGIGWQLEIGVAHRFRYGTAQVDFVHYCRHAIDDIDPPGPEYVLGYIATQRTMSVNGPRLRFISPGMQVGGRISVRGAVTGEGYGHAWDGRAVASGPAPGDSSNSWMNARGSLGADVRADWPVWRGSGAFLRASGIDVLFSPSGSRPVTKSHHQNYRIELGWRAGGHRGGLELYGAIEQLFDDLSSVVPQGSRVVGIGLRLAERNQF